MNAARDFLLHEGSTRAAALMRIGVALLLWARFAGDLTPHEHIGAWPIAIAFYLSTTGMLLGLFTRWSTAAAGLTLLYMVYIAGHARFEPWTHHHTTLLAHATALLALTPCGNSYSLDRWLDPSLEERGPTWSTKLIAVQLSVLYLSTAYDKCSVAFLNGERLQHAFQTLYWGGDAVPWVGYAPLMAVSAVVVVALEFILPIGLWFRRAQPVLIPVGLALHAVIYLAVPVGTFSLTMAVLYLAYLDADAVHAALDRIQRPAD